MGTLRGYARKVVVIGCYIPPNDVTARAKECLDHITDVVIEARRKYSDPFLIIAGDFNQWDVAHALRDYSDVSEVMVGPTQGNRSIDRLFTNFGDMVVLSLIHI